MEKDEQNEQTQIEKTRQHSMSTYPNLKKVIEVSDYREPS